MNKGEVKKLQAGLYVLHWKNGGGFSLAAVGCDATGAHWFAATNWTHVPSFNWRLVKSVDPIAMRTYTPFPGLIQAGGDHASRP